MPSLGPFRSPHAARTLGALALLGALTATVALQWLSLWLKRAESWAWWASNGRDVANAVAFVGNALALYLLGFTWPSALAAGGTLTLFLLMGQAVLAAWPRIPRPALVSFLWAYAAGMPVLLFPRAVHSFFSALAKALFELR